MSHTELVPNIPVDYEMVWKEYEKKIRDAALEEAAVVCDEAAKEIHSSMVDAIAREIRALKGK